MNDQTDYTSSINQLFITKVEQNKKKNETVMIEELIIVFLHSIFQ